MRLISLLAGLLAACALHAATPIRVLLLTGDNNHEWRATTPVLQKILTDSGRFAVEVVERPADLKPADLERFDVVLSNFNTFAHEKTPQVWDTAMREAFIAWIKAGHGLAVVHSGSSVFYDWPEFQALAGTSWGPRSHHGKNHRARVTPVAEDHPITRGIEPFETMDEFWQGSTLSPGTVVLATVTPSAEFGGKGPEPIAVATHMGRGRGFTLLLGHDVVGMTNSGFAQLLARGTEWAATGDVR